jgi:rare lipoprotein A
MRFPTQCHSIKIRALLAASAFALVATGPADASKRNPAPIVYAGQGGTVDPVRNVPAATAPSRSSAPAPGEEGNRIAFRYPGQAAMRPPEPVAREYASVNAPQRSAPKQVTEQAMTPDSFDAQAVAARIAAAREAQVVESEPLVALEPVPQTQGLGTVTPVPMAVAPASAYLTSLEAAPVFDETGISVTYGDEFSGLPTANGEVFEQDGMTAAHPTLPLPSLVQVINLDTQKQVVVRVNDRGPFEDGASLQLSKRAASELESGPDGRANVRVRYLGPAPVNHQTVAYKPSMTSERVIPTSYTVGAQAPEQMPVIYASANQVAAPVFTASAQTGQGAYFVQVGSFADIGNAQSFQQSLGYDLPVLIVPARVNGSDYFRVRVGPLDTWSYAAEMRDELADRGIANGRIVSAD